MRDEYQQIFNREFEVFHNLADDSYLPLPPPITHKFSKKNALKLLFIGSLFKTLHAGAVDDICTAVRELNQEGYPIEFHLYGQVVPSNFLSSKINGQSVTHHGLIATDERFEIMNEHHAVCNSCIL